MKKVLTAVTAGLLLAASQAAAANQTAAVRVGDRVGARAGASDDFAGVPLAVLLVGGAIIVAGISVASDDDSESD